MSSPSETTSESEDKISLAFEYAKAAHSSIDHKRKYSGKPYINHPLAVLGILVGAGETDRDVLAASLLHDVLEDVYPVNGVYRPEMICEMFGAHVLEYVRELTDQYTPQNFPALNRAERKSKEAERIATISDGALKVKLADLIDNTSDIVENDPAFGKAYLKEKSKILDLLTPRILDTKDPVILTLFHKAKTQVIYHETKR
jgi:(p)ppGpp synthase/HD superfamily hydrolase